MKKRNKSITKFTLLQKKKKCVKKYLTNKKNDVILHLELNIDHKTVETEIKLKKALTESLGCWEPNRDAV